LEINRPHGRRSQLNATVTSIAIANVITPSTQTNINKWASWTITPTT
jgi:hypothetical protein